VGRWFHTATAVIEPSQVVSKLR